MRKLQELMIYALFLIGSFSVIHGCYTYSRALGFVVGGLWLLVLGFLALLLYIFDTDDDKEKSDEKTDCNKGPD